MRFPEAGFIELLRTMGFPRVVYRPSGETIVRFDWEPRFGPYNSPPPRGEQND